ncbi:DUF72 domain-containing protein [candidate division KSB1 bacterium]|nr:DUF72 domain-containing protein [candidate division KSB1 bacterium]
MNALRLGTSGWSYKDWRGNFYPERAASTRWLELYCREFNSVEVDSTFYGTPPLSRVQRWAEIAPPGFEFALKVPQEITHTKSLRNCESEITGFLKTVAALGDHLGPVLFQFPYGFTPERLGDLLAFLDHLPRSEFRFVVEIRNRRWLKSGLPAELAARRLPLCWVDHPWMPRDTQVTGELVYLRFLGDHEKITEYSKRQEDRTPDLQWWAEQTVDWIRRDFPVFGYFNNHFSGHAPTDARAFAELLKGML